MSFKTRLIAMVAIGLSLFSCQTEEISSSSGVQGAGVENAIYNEKSGGQSDIITSDDMEYVGIAHNNWMNDVYNYLSQSGAYNAFPCIVLSDIITEALPAEMEEPSKIKELVYITALQVANSDGSALYAPEIEEYLTPVEMDFLNQMHEVINSVAPYSADIVEQRIIEIENEIALNKELSNKQLYILYSATNIAKYTAEYWTKENVEKWRMVERNGVNRTTLGDDFSWGQLVGADVAGGVGAAVNTWYVNAVPGGGQAAYGTAIVGGAVGASVGDAIYQLWSWGYSISPSDCL